VHAKNNQDDIELDLPKEDYRLSLVVSVDSKLAKADYEGAAYYQAKYYLDYLCFGLGIQASIKNVGLDELSQQYKQLVAPFELVRSGLIEVGGEVIGVVGEPSQKVRRNLKLPNFTSMIELDLAKLLEHSSSAGYTKLSTYPFVEQDVCFKLPNTVTYQELFSLLDTTLQVQLINSHSSLSPIDIFQRAEDPANKQITLRLRICSYEKTLTSSEVNAIISNLGEAAKQQFGAEIV
jgi:phenylalanyl-tRNA synthetase beta subunit